ncbi:MAG: lipopolysaccharide heptosyltransferase II [Herminiimonas sp.]|nr:lipopolysaccharide heptosyltransferase II [Herminiimonas sp.]
MHTAATRILIISPNWIGDAVMAQPLLQLLRAQQPDYPIDVMAPPSVAPVWRAMAEVDTVLETPFRHGALQWRERRAFAAQLRLRGYGAAYVLPNTLKFALVPWLARIPRRVGYRGEMRYGLLNVIHHDQKDVPRPMVPFYAALAAPPVRQAAGLASLPKPRLQVASSVRQAVLVRFGIDTAAPLVVFAPGAEFGNAKRWPTGHFARLGQAILAHYPTASIVLLGSPKDRPVCARITAAAGEVAALRNLAGETSLDDAIALIAAATAMVSNDSGLLHVASALNRPVVAIYGPTDPLHAPPFSDVARSLYLGLDCAPCRQRECPLGHHHCMEKLLPEMVWQPLQPMLAASAT